MKAKLFSMILFFFLLSCQEKRKEYLCKPCDLPCDTITFTEPGTCSHCGMELLLKSKVLKQLSLKKNEIVISTGSGYFRIDGGENNQENTITVFYHKPKKFSKDSEILLVIPGAGRNGDTYRDAWMEESEKYNLLILSPMYPEEEYSFTDYHLCGLIKDSNLKSSIEYVENTNLVNLDEEQFTFKVNANPTEWIFNDFDRIFDLVVNAENSSQETYNIFGHSAGGHILHRQALFYNNSKASKILAANPSFYTLPDFDYEFPFGFKNAPIEQESLKDIFNKKLVVFLGEHDNENESGGTFLRSKSADEQGLHRLGRGKFFFNKAKKMAADFKLEFNWEIVVVPEVGHDHRLMGDAAGKYLYED